MDGRRPVAGDMATAQLLDRGKQREHAGEGREEEGSPMPGNHRDEMPNLHNLDLGGRREVMRRRGGFI
jgi:hypothetical protein